MLIESKSNLAKLMATENIIVEQRSVSTAHFNLGTRTLVVPTLKSELSGVLYDLFIGHEVGHALNTPLDGWHDSITDLGVNRSILNVCEDVRIEKLIRRKYPGLKMAFIKAYRELLNQDFFGVKGKDLEALKFIDRLNLHCKCGSSLGIIFNQSEMVLVKEAEDAETFEETVEVAKKIQQLMKEQAEEQKAKAKIETSEDEEPGEEGSEDFMEDEESESYEGSDEEVDGTSVGQDNALESDTDNEFRKREQDLYENNGRDTSYGNIPMLNSADIIIDYKEIYKQIKDISNSLNTDNLMHYEQSAKINNELFVKFRKESNKVVSYLTKEFELRKNADQMKKASIAKTGDLNMNKIYSYRFAEDIFKKISVVPNGKSHGLVLFLDWSGSMQSYMQETVKQLLSLVLFCKKVSIPFEVYAFSDSYNRDKQIDYDNMPIKYDDGDILLQRMNLLNVLSSRMNSAELSFAGSVLLSGIHRYSYYDRFRLGSTPLNETIIAAMDIIPKFQRKYKLQLVNTVFLTDGEGHGLPYTYSSQHGRVRNYGSLIIRDPVTQAQMRYENNIIDNSKAFLYLLKQRTNCNIIGFRILTPRDMKQYLYSIYGDGGNYDRILTEFRKLKSSVIKSAGFDEYYLLRADKMATDEDDELEVKSTTTRGLVSAFKQYTKGHIQNRVILNRFIGLIT